MEAKVQRFKFECPKCGATPGVHGRGGDDKCTDGDLCAGIICNCDLDTPGYDESDHGESHAHPCSARCYH